MTKMKVYIPLHKIFAKHTKIFPNYFPMALKAGEASGNLADVLDYIANFLEKTNVSPYKIWTLFCLDKWCKTYL